MKTLVIILVATGIGGLIGYSLAKKKCDNCMETDAKETTDVTKK